MEMLAAAEVWSAVAALAAVVVAITALIELRMRLRSRGPDVVAPPGERDVRPGPRVPHAAAANPRPVTQLLGARVRELRLARGISQEALAERSGVDRIYVAGIERGERRPSISSVEKIADALEVTLAALVSDGERAGTR